MTPAPDRRTAAFVVGSLCSLAVTVALLMPDGSPEPPPPEPVAQLTVDTGPTDDDALTRAHAQLVEADAHVAALTEELDRAERALTESRRRLAGSREQGGDLAEQVSRLRAEVDRRQEDLSQAADARDELLQGLVDAVARAEAAEAHLSRVDRLHDAAVHAVRRARWQAFVATSQRQICDRGTARRQVRCEAAVASALGDEVEVAFHACLARGQEAPSLARGGRDVGLPDTALSLPHDRTYGRRGWYVDACDATLPEGADA